MSSFLLLSLLPFALILLNGLRARRQSSYELIPNCLLTRFPIVFVRGRQSPFYFLRYWNTVPQYLRNHGYEIRLADIRQLPTLKARVHLFTDTSTQLDNAWIKANERYIKSLTVVGGNFEPIHMGSEPVIWKCLMFLHQLWTRNETGPRPIWLGLTSARQSLNLHKAYLARAIFLAENDLKCSH